MTTDPVAPHPLTVPQAIQLADAKARINTWRWVRHGGAATAVFGLVLFNYTDALHLFTRWLGGLIPMPRPTGLEIAELVMIAGGVLAAVVGQVCVVRAVTVARRNPVVKDVLDGPGPEGLGGEI